MAEKILSSSSSRRSKTFKDVQLSKSIQDAGPKESCFLCTRPECTVEHSTIPSNFFVVVVVAVRKKIFLRKFQENSKKNRQNPPESCTNEQILPSNIAASPSAMTFAECLRWERLLLAQRLMAFLRTFAAKFPTGAEPQGPGNELQLVNSGPGVWHETFKMLFRILRCFAES